MLFCKLGCVRIPFWYFVYCYLFQNVYLHQFGHLGTFGLLVWDTSGWLHDKCHVTHSFWKLSFWNFAQVLLPSYNFSLKLSPSSYLNVCFILFILKMIQKRKNVWFFIVLSKPDLLCYILLHSIHIYTNFSLFSFKWYQEYAYPWFCAWATGC